MSTQNAVKLADHRFVGDGFTLQTSVYLNYTPQLDESATKKKFEKALVVTRVKEQNPSNCITHGEDLYHYFQITTYLLSCSSLLMLVVIKTANFLPQDICMAVCFANLIWTC